MATMTRQQRRKQERLSKKNPITDDFSYKVQETIYNARRNTLSTTKCVVETLVALNKKEGTDIALIYLSDDNYVVVDEINVNTHKVINLWSDYRGEGFTDMALENLDSLRDFYTKLLS